MNELTTYPRRRWISFKRGEMDDKELEDDDDNDDDDNDDDGNDDDDGELEEK